MMSPKRLTAELERRLDGPHDDDHTAGAALLAAEAIRFLNYATGSHSPTGLVYPATVYAVAGDLSAAAWRMPQLFNQLTEWLAAQQAVGMLGTDDGSPVTSTLAAANANLASAAAAASQLSACLDSLQNSISGLNGRGPNRPVDAL